MGKLVDRIERVQKSSGPRLGFAPVAASKKPGMLLLASIRSANAGLAQAVVQKGADGVLVLERPRGAVADALKLNGQTAVGVAWPEDGDAKTAGDFAVVTASSPVASLIAAEELDVVLRVEDMDLPDAQVRTVEALPVDAVLLPAQSGPVTIATLIAYSRFTRSTSKPVLATVDGRADAGTLRALRDAGVAGFAVEVADTAAAASVEWLRKAIDGLPERKPRRRTRDSVMVGLPSNLGFTPAPQRRGPTPDEDDDDEP
jgi:hypothetical protein